jgi:hypothetical protein
VSGEEHAESVCCEPEIRAVICWLGERDHCG